MEPNREVAWREPPAGLGHEACTAGASALCSVCHKTKMVVQVTNTTQFPAYYLPFAGR